MPAKRISYSKDISLKSAPLQIARELTHSCKASKTNSPHLPERISGLRELAYNLWWSWHPEGRALFKLLSRLGWYLSNRNPAKMINRLDRGALEAATSYIYFMRHYDYEMARFETALS